MVAIFHRYPRLTLLTLFLVIAAGLAALGTMGRQEDPSLVKRFGRVVTIYPGADAARVEALVTQPLENAILELDEVEEIDSSSRAGLSVISVQMNESLSETEVEQAWTKLSDQAAQTIPLLPAEATQPEVIQEILGAATMIVSLRWPEGTEPNIAVLTRLAENLGDDLRNLSGTERVEL
jgi:multidrug efflux pump subunit AcrB